MENQNQITKSEQMFAGINPLNRGQVELAATGLALNFDISANYWTPMQIGEKKRLIYQETATEQAPDFNDPTKLVELRVAKFVEVYINQDGEICQQMIRTAATKILSFIDSFDLPKHACLEIVYKGKMKSKKAARMYDDFAFYPVVINVNQEA